MKSPPGRHPTGVNFPVMSADRSRRISSTLLPTVRSCTLYARTSPSGSMRNVPRSAAPTFSSRTPYAVETCLVKSASRG